MSLTLCFYWAKIYLRTNLFSCRSIELFLNQKEMALSKFDTAKNYFDGTDNFTA
jgi:hypothetical protein